MTFEGLTGQIAGINYEHINSDSSGIIPRSTYRLDGGVILVVTPVEVAVRNASDETFNRLKGPLHEFYGRWPHVIVRQNAQREVISVE